MLNRYPNLTYVVVVVLVDDADEMVTYGDRMIVMAQIVSIFCSPPPLVFLCHLFKSRTILILFFLGFYFV